MSRQQLPLDLGHRPALGRSDLFVTSGNQEAVSWIDRWPEWPSHALALYGAAGCGKTHLVQVFAALSQAHVLDVDALAAAEPLAVASAHKAIALDHNDGPIHERNLFHLFNAVREHQGQLLIVSREPVARWPITLPDLSSRLKSMPAVKIHPPDDSTMAAVLAKLFRDRQIQIAPEVIDYIVTRVPRTFDASRSLVNLVDQEALAQGRRVTIPLIRDVMNAHME